MVLNFDQIDVAVNGSGILSTKSSINSSNSIDPAYVLGYNRPINQLPTGPIKNIFNSTYFPEISKEPNYAIVNKIKSMINDSGYLGEHVQFAGIGQNQWYLDNYSLQIQPNNLVEANVSYSVFESLSGTLQSKRNNIDYIKSGDICHSWTTYILNSNDYLTKPVYEFNYSFQSSWRPIYILGQKTPAEVKLINATESVSFNTDDYRHILFSGENLYGNILEGNNGNLQFRNITLICSEGCDSVENSESLLLNLSGFKIKSINPVAQMGEFLRVNIVADKYY